MSCSLWLDVRTERRARHHGGRSAGTALPDLTRGQTLTVRTLQRFPLIPNVRNRGSDRAPGAGYTDTAVRELDEPGWRSSLGAPPRLQAGNRKSLNPGGERLGGWAGWGPVL